MPGRCLCTRGAASLVFGAVAFAVAIAQDTPMMPALGQRPIGVSETGPVQVPRDAAVTASAGPHGTAYSVSREACRIVWIVAYEGINRGVVMHRPDCRRPLADQAPLFGRILEAIAAEPERRQAIRTLHWGRLFPDGATDGTLSVRVALAAWRSPDWDAKAGRPRSGDINGFIRGLVNETRFAPEIEAVFEARGLAVTVASVEKVLVARPRELPFADALADEGVKPGDLVPWDAQIWFSIREATAITSSCTRPATPARRPESGRSRGP